MAVKKGKPALGRRVGPAPPLDPSGTVLAPGRRVGPAPTIGRGRKVGPAKKPPVRR